MIEICLTVEGQRGLTWPQWQRFVAAVEGLGFAGLFRSDHFFDADPPDQDSLELWTSLTWLADNTKRIEFGTLVTPVSFRHPRPYRARGQGYRRSFRWTDDIGRRCRLGRRRARTWGIRI